MGADAGLEPLVELRHVHAARGPEVVLHDVSLTISPGEHLAILGPNGCGKSTLLKVLTCELYPLARPETRVRIFGRERWDVTELRRRMGVVAADPPGKAALATTGFDTILTGFFSSATLWPNLTVTAAMRDRAEAILLQVGAEALRSRPLGAMSAGQQRRVMIGRAVAGASVDGQPAHGKAAHGQAAHGQAAHGQGQVQMLLLDEPSNALDLSAQQDLRHMLRGLAQSGTAILLITHHVADVLPEMQRVVMMREGAIHADGRKQDLLTGERLSTLFGRHVELLQRGDFFHAW